MIEINNLTKKYGNLKAVNNLSLKVNKGEIFGFIGPNGAGKSTTIRCILKLANKESGVIKVNNINVDSTEEYKDLIGYLPSEINLYENFTVKEIFDYTEKLYRKNCSKKISALVKRLDIDLKKKIRELSFGNLKKIGIVIALMHDPEILILDEATNGLDPLKQKEFFEILAEEREKGVTVFFSSHNLDEVKKVCDRVGIIKNGEVVEIKTVKELTEDNYLIVNVKGKNLSKIKEKNIIEKTENSIKFIYKGDVNKLIKMISELNLEKLSIESPSLEEIFMHYYEGDKND